MKIMLMSLCAIQRSTPIYSSFLLLILFLLFMYISFSCGKSNPDRLDSDIQEIKEYLNLNNIQALETESGLHYMIDTPVEDGGHPGPNSTVTVKYVGSLLSGEVFDLAQAPVEFNVSGLIAGWREGLQLMKIGEEARFYIPSQLGYGSASVGGIPPNSILVFSVELIDFY